MPNVDLRNLSVLSYANGFTHWHYRTTDSYSIVGEHLGYWAGTPKLTVGDLITVTFGPGEGPCRITQFCVEACYTADMKFCRKADNALVSRVRPINNGDSQ